MAANTPMMMPSTTPTAKYRAVFGEDLDVGTCAFCTMESFTGGLISGVQVAFNDVLQRFGNGIGDVRGLLRISIHHGNVHECGVSRIGDGDLAGKIRYGFIQARSSITGLSTFEVVASVGYEVIRLEM